jgi:AcrR family transcriptional regulator
MPAMTTRTTRATRAPARVATRSKPTNGDVTTTGAGLSEASIVKVACEMIGELGTEGLTMRALSDRLGVALGATYHHVPNRDALLLLVTRDIAARVPLPDPEHADWMQGTRDLITGYYNEFSRYRGIVAYIFEGEPDERSGEIAEVVFSMLANAGFSRRLTDTVRAALFFYLRGAILDSESNQLSPDVAPRAFKAGLDLLLKGAQAQLDEDLARRATRSRGSSRPKSSR